MKLFLSLVFALSAFSLASCQENHIIEMVNAEGDSICSKPYILTDASFDEHWADLPQTKFWKEVMLLSPDSCIVNIAATRTIIYKTSLATWKAQSQSQRDAHLDSLRQAYHLAPDAKIYITSGKNDFYRFSEVIPSISNGISEFEKNHVDPWYAQAILMIESPAQIRKSVSGAYGPFQLMPGVARNYGLTVNKYRDERTDFARSAYAASSLLKTICIPKAKEMLTNYGYEYNETDWWFRLFVLHIYHAGAGNVNGVVAEIGKLENGMELIKKMWLTKVGKFGNNSQNYSQLALAAQCILKEKVSSIDNSL